MNTKSLLATLGLALIVSTEANAQLEKGFYRVQNVVTGRYMSVENDYVHVDYASVSANCAAIRTKRLDVLYTNPGSIVYLDPKGSNKYNILSQGYDLYSKFSLYPTLKPNGNAYRAFASKSSVTLYLSDRNTPDAAEGYVRTSGSSTRDWYVKPINTTDNYFGVAPKVNSGDYYYQPLYAGFAFKPESADTKVYYISGIVNGLAAMKEVTGVVPASTPVIVQTKSASSADNILTPTTEKGEALTNNQLRGVYFCINEPDYDQVNLTKYNASTMRVLRTLSDGTLAYVVDSSLEYLPANESYLLVSEGSPEVIPVVDEATGVREISVDEHQNSAKAGVYTLTGVKLRDNNSTENLPAGVYVVGGKATLVK